MADRYCGNCGHELAENDRFCPNCGAPSHEAARVPTPEADVPVPPPPQPVGGASPWATTSSPTPQAGGASSQRRADTAGRVFVGCIVVVLGLFILFAGTAIIGGSGGNPGSANNPGNQPAGQGQQQGGGMKTAIVRVGGTPGMRFSGDVGNLNTSRSVEGVIPAEYEVKFSTDTWDLDSIYVSFYKEPDADYTYPTGTLSVQIVVDGEVVQETSSSARDGYVSLDWSPSP